MSQVARSRRVERQGSARRRPPALCPAGRRATLLLRDGSLMSALQVPGLLFETEDTDALNAPRGDPRGDAALDARRALRALPPRRSAAGSQVELDGAASTIRSAAHIDRALARAGSASGSLFVNDQFVTLVRRPARGKAGLAERAGKLRCKRAAATGRGRSAASCARCARRRRRWPPRSATTARSCSATTAARAALTNTELLELLSRALQRRDAPGAPARRRDRHRPHAALSPRQLRARRDGAARRRASADFAAILSLKDYPDATAPGMLDELLRLPFEMVVTESFAPSSARPRASGWTWRCAGCARPTRKRWPSAREMLAARDELGAGAAASATIT